MKKRTWSYRETKLNIKSDDEEAIRSAIENALKNRKQIEQFISKVPEFETSLSPLNLNRKEKPIIVRLMLKAGEIAGTGPFASVAGSISQLSAEAGNRSGASNILVDNGGDIALRGDKSFRVGIYAGDSTVSGKLVLLIKPSELPMGICTSSSSVGHSMSFGQADAVVISAEEASVADAVATEVGNKVKGDEVESSVKRGLDRADDIPEIKGCLIIREDHVGTVGELPEILSLKKGETVKPPELASSPAKFFE